MGVSRGRADDKGEVTRLRGRDGVSFHKAGNNRLAQLVLTAIQGASPAGTRAPSGTTETPAPKMRDVPVFGQALAGGESLTIRPRT